MKSSVFLQPLIQSLSHIVHHIFVGNAIATVRSKDPIKIITVRSTAFSPATTDSAKAAPTEELKATQASTTSTWLKEELSKSDRPELGSAKAIVSGGRGMKNGENFSMLYSLADKINGAGK